MNRDPFAALADPTRRQIILLLQDAPQTVTGLAAHFPDMSRQAVTKHLQILEQCGVLALQAAGREKQCSLLAGAFQEVSDFVSRYEAFWSKKLDRLGTYLDG